MKQAKMFKGENKKKLYKLLMDSMNKKEEVYLTADETVSWGFADSIFSSWDEFYV
jgi:ATP-dependent protease ClpP protease subunit